MKKRINFFGLLIMVSIMFIILAACSGSNGEENSANSPSGNSTPSNGASSEVNDETDEADESESNVYEENGLPKDEEVTIRVGFREQGYGREWYDLAVEKFSERFPNVTFDTTYTPNLGTILTPMVAAGNDEDIYDLFYPNFEGADTFRELTTQGRFEPMDEMWERELYDEPGVTLRSVVNDSAYQVNSTLHGGDTTYNLPGGSQSRGLFYDDDLFTEKGWNKNPQTWDEFVDLLEAIKQDGIIPITYPGMYPRYLNEFVFSMYPWAVSYSEGTFEEFEQHYQQVEQPYFTHDLIKQQYMNIYELGQKGYFPQGVAALTHLQSQMQVLRAEAALVSTGDWVSNEMKDSTPEGFQWGFMSIPFTNNPDDPIFIQSSFGTTDFVIWKEKPELVKQWAKEFLLFLYDMELQEAMAASGMYPARVDYVDDQSRIEAMADAGKALAQYAADNNVIQYAPRTVVSMTSPAWSQARTNIIGEAVPAMSEGREDPIPILEQAEELLSQAWEDQGGRD